MPRQTTSTSLLIKVFSWFTNKGGYLHSKSQRTNGGRWSSCWSVSESGILVLKVWSHCLGDYYGMEREHVHRTKEKSTFMQQIISSESSNMESRFLWDGPELLQGPEDCLVLRRDPHHRQQLQRHQSESVWVRNGALVHPYPTKRPRFVCPGPVGMWCPAWTVFCARSSPSKTWD